MSSRYLLAPTTTGKVFVWSLLNGGLVAVLCAHSDVIRDIVFHPTREYLITCGDGTPPKDCFLSVSHMGRIDSIVQIFRPKPRLRDQVEEQPEEESEEEESLSKSEEEPIQKVAQEESENVAAPSTVDAIPAPKPPADSSSEEVSGSEDGEASSSEGSSYDE